MPAGDGGTFSAIIRVQRKISTYVFGFTVKFHSKTGVNHQFLGGWRYDTKLIFHISGWPKHLNHVTFLLIQLGDLTHYTHLNIYHNPLLFLSNISWTHLNANEGGHNSYYNFFIFKIPWFAILVGFMHTIFIITLSSRMSTSLHHSPRSSSIPL